MWDNAHEKERGRENGVKFCHKLRVGAECGSVKVPGMCD